MHGLVALQRLFAHLCLRGEIHQRNSMHREYVGGRETWRTCGQSALQNLLNVHVCRELRAQESLRDQKKNYAIRPSNWQWGHEALIKAEGRRLRASNANERRDIKMLPMLAQVWYIKKISSWFQKADVQLLVVPLEQWFQAASSATRRSSGLRDGEREAGDRRKMCRVWS